MARSEREVRLEVFNSFKDLYASAPIRLMSRTVNARIFMQAPRSGS